jgi:uncharacterized protein VirK/YbjX
MNLWRKTWTLWHEHPRERVKLALGWLFHRQSTHRWLSYLHAHEALWRQVPRFPKLVTRIYRPYALRRLGCAQRVQHMIGHHDSLHRLGLFGLLERSVDQPLHLLQLPTKDDTPAELRLVSVHDGHREGEMHLQLYWDGQWLYSLSFLLRPQAQACEMVITRLQGTREPQARELIRAATKGFHGLRPSTLLVQAARQLAQSAGCSLVLLVSHQQRVALNPMRRWKLHSDVETLWQELGAAPHPEGFFALGAAVEVPQDFSDVASNKRAEARRKAELLRQTLSGVDLAVCQARPPA